MKLHVIASGSAGNCYVLNGNTSALVLECAVSPDKTLSRVGVAPSRIAGALVTHEHGDHAGFVKKFNDIGIDVYASAGTIDNCKTGSRRHIKIVAAMKTYQIGEFTVKAFDVVHDAAEPLGYIIEHPEMGRLLFATDTRFVRYNFKNQNLNHIMIEANYNDDILTERTMSGDILPTQAERVRQSHLSISQAGAFIAANVTPYLNNVILVHLSSGNANREEFARIAAENAPYSRVWVAVRDLVVELTNDEI